MGKRKQRPKVGRWGKRKKEERDWKAYNEKQVRRAELLLPLHLAREWRPDLADLNEDKIGRPYEYPKALVEALGFWKCFCKMDYRTTQGIGRQMVILLKIPASPHSSTICRRLRRLGRERYMKRDNSAKGKSVYGLFDGSGLKVCNRGEWMHYKHKGKRKGFVRLVLVTDAKTGKVLEFSATTEKVGERRKFKPLLKRLCKNNKVKRVGGDGLYDTNEIFDELKKRNIKPSIKIRRNADDGPPHQTPEMQARLEEVRKFKQWGYKEWAKRRKYGQRWRVEGSFSRYKGYFGEYVYSKGMSNIKAEVGLKMYYLNQLL